MSKINYMESSGREKIEDQIFKEDTVVNEQFPYKLFIRIGAKKVKFVNTNFSHTYFDHCYFRDCIFESCDFTGCKFLNSNFTGSSFPNSKFEYSIFEKTFVDNDILETSSPKAENLRLKFARSLRTNYSALGDIDSVSKAMNIELHATRKHHFNSWFSEINYYRDKYTGTARLKAFIDWMYFSVQDFIWGNGEKAGRLLRTGLYLWIIMTLYDVFNFGNSNLISSYMQSFFNMPSIFFGIEQPTTYSKLYLAFIALLRLIGFGLFMSLIIKKYNKR